MGYKFHLLNTTTQDYEILVRPAHLPRLVLTRKLWPNLFKDMNGPTYSNCTKHDIYFRT